MSNGKYRSEKVKDICWEKVNKQTQGHHVVFSIDAAKVGMYGALMVEKEKVLVILKWKHPEETRDVVEQISQGIDCVQMDVALEPSGTYGDPLKYQFNQAGLEVYRVSPKKTFDAKEIYDGVPSLHDGKSTYVIGRLHLDGNSRLWKEKSTSQRKLTAEIETLGLYRSAYQRNLNRLEGKLARYWPEVLGLLCLDSVALEGLLIEYRMPQEIGSHAREAAALMRRIGRGMLKDEKIEKIITSAERTLGVVSIEAERQAMGALAQELRHLRVLEKEATRRIEKTAVEDTDICCLSEVIGKVTAAVMVAKLGSPRDYDSSASYVKAMGLNLKEKSSGKFKGQKKISKRGSSLVRMYLYFVAMRMVNKDPVVQAWYKKKIRRDGGQIHMKGLIAVMRKIAKALWYVGQGEVFDSRRLFNEAVLGMK